MLVGGDSMEAQFAELAAFPDVLVATPGGRDYLHAVHAVVGGDSMEAQFLSWQPSPTS